ncbi:MAG: sigma-70 family RNA polymerase sigma factor [Lachnospiraceae bacterium]|nr:sigma-70 family RNA polymerase sigma factor [Lachnospiraceae bacterium]
MNDKDIFAAQLARIREKAASQQGSVSVSDVLAAFPGRDLSEEQIRLIYAYMEENGIRLADYEPQEEGILLSELAAETLAPPESQEDRRSYELYMEDLEALEPISREEEEKLQRSLLKGSAAERKAAVNRLTEGNLRWVVQIARGFENNGVSLTDLIQEGNLSLFMAVNEYNGEGNVEDFLEKAIKQGIKSYIREHNGQKKIEERMMMAANRILEAAKAFESTEGRAMSAEELSKKLGIPVSRVEEVLRESAKAIQNATH